MPRKGTTTKTPKAIEKKLAKAVENAPVFSYADSQARLAAISHAISIGKEAGLNPKTWIPHVLQNFGGYSVEQAKKFFPEGEYPEATKVAATADEPEPEPVTAGSAAASI